MRLYYIFMHLRTLGKLLNDWVLIGVVILLAAIDVVLCSIWTAGFMFSTVEHKAITERNTVEVRVTCHSEAYHGVLTLYQGMMTFSALVLALLTKNIRHMSFKTKSVTFFVYSLTLALCLGCPLYFIISGTGAAGVDVEYSILSLTYNALLYLCFALLFFPPILTLLKSKLSHQELPAMARFAKESKLSSSYQMNRSYS